MSADVDSGSPPADGSVTWRFTDRTRTSTFGGYLSTDQLRFDGTVSGIDAGPSSINARTIQNSIMLRTGRVFRYVDLTESQRNLYESNLFRLALFTVPPRPDSIKNINIDVRETRMREARIAGGFNTIDYIQTDGRFTNYNTFGGARRNVVRRACPPTPASGSRPS